MEKITITLDLTKEQAEEILCCMYDNETRQYKNYVAMLHQYGPKALRDDNIIALCADVSERALSWHDLAEVFQEQLP
ncbi:hypothetical protein [uncultured Desulfovibrio sp.]|uniref:hypothetical protein n=1 Tax=uncultured Desulfovibrio sp. TaxID=167968 RepID=UPI0026131902|nr:hypothetical protein [uncultured Desulfovibrio sp.]